MISARKKKLLESISERLGSESIEYKQIDLLLSIISPDDFYKFLKTAVEQNLVPNPYFDRSVFIKKLSNDPNKMSVVSAETAHEAAHALDCTVSELSEVTNLNIISKSEIMIKAANHRNSVFHNYELEFKQKKKAFTYIQRILSPDDAELIINHTHFFIPESADLKLSELARKKMHSIGITDDKQKSLVDIYRKLSSATIHVTKQKNKDVSVSGKEPLINVLLDGESHLKIYPNHF
jgi:hypothetical protein